MKNNEKLTKIAYLIEQKKNIPVVKEELLEILFNRFYAQLQETDCEKLGDVLQTTFLVNLYASSDEGIAHILELEEYDELDSFATDYCMTFEDAYGYEAQGYKVTWDYKTYYSELQKQTDNKTMKKS